MSNSSISLVDRTLSDATTPGQSGPGSDGNEVVLRIPQSSSITGASPSDCLVSYPGHLLGGGVLPLWRDAVSVFYSSSQKGYLEESYPSAVMQLVYSTATAKRPT